LDYYAILGVHPTAEDIVIRAAYKALAQRYHPDRFAGSQDEAHRKMSELTKAYDVLADPVRRQKYDRRRLTYTQSVATYFNGSAKFPPPVLDPRELRSAAAKRKRSRIALSALMLAVVVLSAFNLVQYSGQIKDWLGAGLPASSAPTDADPRRIGEAAVAPKVGAAPAEAPRSAAAAEIPGLAIAPSGGAAAAAPVAGAQIAKGSGEDVPRQAGADAAAATPTPHVASTAAAPPAAAPAVAAPPATTPLVAAAPATTPAGAAPPATTPAAATPAAATAVAVQPAATTLPMVDRRAGAATDRARSAPADRPITIPPATSASESCRDAVAALGLCNPSTTARNK
jgi:hypothetical protein